MSCNRQGMWVFWDWGGSRRLIIAAARFTASQWSAQPPCPITTRRGWLTPADIVVCVPEMHDLFPAVGEVRPANFCPTGRKKKRSACGTAAEFPPKRLRINGHAGRNVSGYTERPSKCRRGRADNVGSRRRPGSYSEKARSSHGVVVSACMQQLIDRVRGQEVHNGVQSGVTGNNASRGKNGLRICRWGVKVEVKTPSNVRGGRPLCKKCKQCNMQKIRR